MKFFFFYLFLFFIYIKYYSIAYNINNNSVYFIKSYSNNYYIKSKSNDIILGEKFPSYFGFIKLKFDTFFIYLPFYKNKYLGVSKKDKIIIYNNQSNINIKKISWKIIKIKNNKYILQNIFNKKFLEENQNSIKFSNIKIINFNELDNKIMNNKILFKIFKIYKFIHLKKKDIKFIEKEPIDLVVKYIDLNDKTLNRNGIKQTYKDIDNEEFRYCLRSILNYIPWVRKIFILMPNEKVKYLKEKDEIKEKIIYIKDKQFLGFDSANIQSFLFNLDKMRYFGISNNFIYMEDDYFIGKNIKKKDFFYYDKFKKRVFPNIITWGFYDMNRSEVINQYNELIKDTYNSINAHSRIGFLIQRLNTEIFFIKNFRKTIINTLFTHNAIPENINDLKAVYKFANKYIYFNETLYNKERNLFSLCHQHFLNLYQLNINQRRVNPILSSYIAIEKIKRAKLNKPLFVINTGGNHIPLDINYKIEKKVINKRFPFKNIYEATISPNNKIYFKKSVFIKILKILIISKLIKIYFKFYFIFNEKNLNSVSTREIRK